MNQVGFVLVTTLASLVLAQHTEKEAQDFIQNVNKDVQRMNDDFYAKKWALDTAGNAVTDQIKNQYKEADEKYDKYQEDIYKKILEYPRTEFKDQNLKRMFFATMVCQDFALPKDKLNELNAKVKEIDELNVKPEVKDLSGNGPLLSYLDVQQRAKEVGLDSEKLKYYWVGVHNTVARQAKEPFMKIMNLKNEVARLNGYPDFSKLSQAAYEVDNFEKTMLQLYEDIKPLFLELHAYVRYNLWDAYGRDNNKINPHGPIPASLLGQFWGVDASPVFEQVAPFSGKPLLNITQAIKDSEKTVRQMAEEAQAFYTSMGLRPLPQDFWEHSIFEKKEKMDCFRFCYNFKDGQDIKNRLKLCAQPTQDGHVLLHDRLGVMEYVMALREHQSYYFYQQAPNLAFDFAFQSVLCEFPMAPNYLKSLGFLDPGFKPDYELKIKTLLKNAVQYVFSLPFTLAWDQWRWRVADGSIKPHEYNCKYWEVRTNLQGVEPPVDRDENDFDPGERLRYIKGDEHIPHFIAEFLKLDVLRGLCKTAGYYDPQSKPDNALVFCDIHGNHAVGAKLKEYMESGKSVPWYIALEKITGHRNLDSSALLEYYRPLYDWLREQNKINKATVGWTSTNKCHQK